MIKTLIDKLKGNKWSSKEVTLDNGITLTPFTADAPLALPIDMLAIPGELAGEMVDPGHIETYLMPEVGWVVAQYHGVMPNGDVVLTMKPL